MLPLVCDSVHASWYRFDFEVMGTSAAVELWHDSEHSASLIAGQVEAEMRRINEVMSPYIYESELSQINQLDKNNEHGISEEMYRVLKIAQEIAEDSEGVFDISFASVGFLYDYRERRRPDAEQLGRALKSVDYRSIVLREGQAVATGDHRYSINFLRDGMKLDLGGIAKGYAVDRGVGILLEHGVQAGLALIEKFEGYDAIVIDADGKVHYSSGLSGN